jgi:hypothetical protein
MTLHASFEQLFGDPEHFFLIFVVSRAAKRFELCMERKVHGFEFLDAAGILAERNPAFANAIVRFFHGPVHGLKRFAHGVGVAERYG